ncbi:MAG: hypothetical protein MJY89_06045 [Bacteroidales bacterium]|nr:hypothetical protein [Bacteroidales bacterium]
MEIKKEIKERALQLDLEKIEKSGKPVTDEMKARIEFLKESIKRNII